MSIVDTPEFQEKAAAHRKKMADMRAMHARNVFDQDSAHVETTLTPEALIKAMEQV